MELKELSDKELLEDIAYYIKETQIYCLPSADNYYKRIYKDLKILQERENV